jgi:acyl-CoA thioesterase
MTDLEQARDYFSHDRFATECAGAVIETAEPGHAVCTLDIQPQHCNALGKPMGGLIFTLADFAFAVASNFHQPATVSLTNQITFLSPAKGHRLLADARAVKSGRSTCYYQVNVTDELGTQVAAMTVNGFVVDKG